MNLQRIETIVNSRLAGEFECGDYRTTWLSPRNLKAEPGLELPNLLGEMAPRAEYHTPLERILILCRRVNRFLRDKENQERNDQERISLVGR